MSASTPGLTNEVERRNLAIPSNMGMPFGVRGIESGSRVAPIIPLHNVRLEVLKTCPDFFGYFDNNIVVTLIW